MTVTVRTLVEADRPAADELGRLAFGGARPAPDAIPPARPGRTVWAVEDAGRIVAVAADRRQSHWYGGRLVPASGVASVAVAPADRGRGHARTVMTSLLAAARERGAVISTLFPTAPALYRGLGYERAGALTWWSLRTDSLARLRMPRDVTLRAATAGDGPQVSSLYAGTARAANGWLDRDTLEPPDDPVGDVDGVTLAIGPGGEVEGSVRWDRGNGYKEDGRLTVHDLVAATGRATQALLASLASWSAVTPTLLLNLPEPDPVSWLLPGHGPVAHSRDPWMLRLVDAPGAIAARGWPAHLEVSVDLDLVDAVCGWNAGRHRLEIVGGAGTLTPGGSGDVLLGPRALALLYGGGVSAAMLRRAGLLHTDGGRHDHLLDALAAGPAPALLDYF